MPAVEPACVYGCEHEENPSSWWIASSRRCGRAATVRPALGTRARSTSLSGMIATRN